MPQISVIVPVYKVEPYLRRCVDSILSQTFTDFELILVDDGSPDGCPAICDEYAKKDSRVRVIHKENGGVSSARNAGLDAAKGEYIGFVDGDDFLVPEMYERLLLMLETNRADVVYCEAQFIHSDGSITRDTLPFIESDQLLKKSDWLECEKFRWIGGVNHALYRANVIEYNKIRFPENLIFSEDRIFNLYVFGLAGSVFCTKYAPYNIVLHSDSCIQSFHPNHFEQALKAKRLTDLVIDEIWDGAVQLKEISMRQFIEHTVCAIQDLNRSGYSFTRKYKLVKKICKNDEVQKSLDGNFEWQKSDFANMIRRKKILSMLLWNHTTMKRIYYHFLSN